ncbi:ABC-F family ATP-binding cassette domain-containing protein [Agromyces subbeticus]|uniref:ABC-F family ATP-binding cassette domain-containing protein n=1 Tax=Agromyces subbeticus TaxID=293890 RepID=UPI0003B5CA3C|nr:ABC-F family ATP-binding cassette domain-containing protein [Agromyces subbeticus]
MYPSQLSLHAVTKRFGARVVLDRIDLALRPGERVGIIGDNGSGKSTLLRLMSGELQSDAGEVTRAVPGGIGVLSQVLELHAVATVNDAIDACSAELRDLERAVRAAEHGLAHLDGAALDAALASYAEMTERFEARDGYGAPARLDAAMSALGVGGLDRSRSWATLSGGERSRVALAATLAANPELLLLDEPSNDLDDAAWQWLVDRLRHHEGTVVAVTHDRAFLQVLTEVIWEVDDASVARYGNGYAGYLVAKASERERHRLAYEAWNAELARNRDLVTANAGRLAAIPRKLDKPGMGTGAFRARGRDHGAMGRIRNAKERVSRLLDDPVAPPAQPLAFTPALDRPGPVEPAVAVSAAAAAPLLLELCGVRVAAASVDELQVAPGGRVLITGRNGVGKTSLLRVIAGEQRADAGSVTATRRIGHLRQHSGITPTQRTLLETYARGIRDDVDTAERRLMALGLFHPRDLAVPVAGLSYGQRRRLELALLVSEPHELLLLDEPTNHLSPDLVEDLERALEQFGGAVMLVSHDRLMRERFHGERLELAG